MEISSTQWHSGERGMRRMLRVPDQDNPTVRGLKPAHAYRAAVSPLVALGTLDERGRPWATVWGGEAGFCRPVAENVLGVRATADASYDPVLWELFAVHDNEQDSDASRRIVDDEIVRPEGGKLMAALTIDLETRDRLKLMGRMIGCTANCTAQKAGVADLQMAFAVEEALGNCPKYLNKKHITPHSPCPELEFSGPGPMPREAVEIINKGDLFFMASKHGDRSMDVNHRGGAPGFMRVLRNQPADDGTASSALFYPEYSGNRLYQTLGNLREDPVVGLVIPDFETGDVLYLTGRSTILVAEQAAAYMPRTKLAVRIDVDEARFVRDGLPFRGSFMDHSPYTPPVRKLAVENREGEEEEVNGPTNAIAVATLLRKHVVTPSISRYVFKVTPPVDQRGASQGKGERLTAWHPGQHVTLDFSAELDMGYSHMRDDEPQSLNDDFVRTFTVSAPLDPASIERDNGDESGQGQILLREDVQPELEIVVRRHGPATALLASWNPRVSLEVPILGFGGVEAFRMPLVSVASEKESIFVASGVGVTPLLAQAAGVLGPRTDSTARGKLKVLWSLRAEDLPLAEDSFTNVHGLGPVTGLFVAGSLEDKARDVIRGLQGLGAEVSERRMEKADVDATGTPGARKFFCCTGPAMLRTLLFWMEKEDVVFESFQY